MLRLVSSVPERIKQPNLLLRKPSQVSEKASSSTSSIQAFTSVIDVVTHFTQYCVSSAESTKEADEDADDARAKAPLTVMAVLVGVASVVPLLVVPPVELLLSSLAVSLSSSLVLSALVQANVNASEKEMSRAVSHLNQFRSIILPPQVNKLLFLLVTWLKRWGASKIII